MKQPEKNVLEVKNLSVSFHSTAGEVQAVRDVSFSLKKGEVLAIVGESGCGKSVLCKSIMKLLPGSAQIKSGKILLNGTDITDYKEKEMQKIRGSAFSMIFQDPMTSLNPTIKIGQQIAEAILVHHPKKSREEVYNRVIELMELVGIERPKERYHLYPWHFSGGMRQRSVMAIALASNPDILFADEPTTALDVTIQAQILDLLREIQKSLEPPPFWYHTTLASLPGRQIGLPLCMQEKLWRSEPQRKSIMIQDTPIPGGCCAHCLLFPVGNHSFIPFPACLPH